MTKKSKAKALVSLVEKNDPIKLQLDGLDFEIEVNQDVSLEMRSAIISSVETAYFKDGVYDAAYGKEIIDYVIFQLLTNVDFGSDLEAFVRFKGTEAYNKIVENYPAVIMDIKDSVEAQIKFLTPKYNMPYEQKMFYVAGEEFLEVLNNFISNTDDVIKNVSNELSGVNKDEIEDIIASMKMLGKKTDKQIVSAVLEYQKNKTGHDASGEVPVIKQ